MHWLLKSLLTTLAVWLVMGVARRGRHRVAGLVAAVPTITAPTLAWLAAERGAEFAAQAAVGSVAACAMLALFALGYARACASHGVPVALGCGLAGLGLMALPACLASDRLADAVALAGVCCALALALLPRLRLQPQAAHQAGHAGHADQAAPARPASAPALPAAAASGGLTALSVALGPLFGSFAAGLLSSLPVVTGTVAVLAHARSGPQTAQRFLHGYVEGLLGKIAFGAVFAVLVTRIGAPAALALACPAAIAVPLLCRLPHRVVAVWPAVCKPVSRCGPTFFSFKWTGVQQ